MESNESTTRSAYPKMEHHDKSTSNQYNFAGKKAYRFLNQY